MGGESEEITFAETGDGGMLHISRFDNGTYQWTVEYSSAAAWVVLDEATARQLVNDLVKHFESP